METVFFVTAGAIQCGLEYANVTMKEIISLNLGEQGTRVGSQFWRMISAEHGLSEGGQLGCSSQNQVNRIGVFWEEQCCHELFELFKYLNSWDRIVVFNIHIHWICNFRIVSDY